MAWDDGLLVDQRQAAGHSGSHARLLAGPGTGKTRVLTSRICYLIKELGVEPEDILVLTFTRAAAAELRSRVRAELGQDVNPYIATLHSYALRQLLKNWSKFSNEPVELHIADDWEERNVIFEELKETLQLSSVDVVKDLFRLLSADWETFAADQEGWESHVPNPQFIGAWREHRKIYAYMLRAELVYRLKRALEQYGDFRIDGPPKYLFVDEYQDLNPCDLALVRQIVARGAELFVAGDDDQSIYGFRMGHPEGIRRFMSDYVNSKNLELSVCKRCSQEILEYALWVARQDPRRLEKHIHSDTVGGKVRLLHFANQSTEAEGIAQICQQLMSKGLLPSQILILLRSDRHQAFSSVICDAMEQAGIPVSRTAKESPIDDKAGRQVLSLLRLLVDENNSLAWRSLLSVRKNGLGNGAMRAVFNLAVTLESTFLEALLKIHDDPTIVPGFGNKLSSEFDDISNLLDSLDGSGGGSPQQKSVQSILDQVILQTIVNADEQARVRRFLSGIIDSSGATSIPELVFALDARNADIEQDMAADNVNILTMHRAKGLTAEAVIIVGVEQESIPGRAHGESQLGDERRLLYVSLTRATKYLFITYCDRRTGRQRHAGSNSGSTQRRLSEFLSDGPLSQITAKPSH